MRSKKFVEVFAVMFALLALAGFVTYTQRAHNPGTRAVVSGQMSPAKGTAPIGAGSSGFGGGPLSYFSTNVVQIGASQQAEVFAPGSKSMVIAPEVVRLIGPGPQTAGLGTNADPTQRVRP